MYHQIRYVLLLLTLALFGFTSFGYSQDTVEKPSEELKPIEQSTQEPNPLATQFKELETQFSLLKNRLDNSENRLNILEDSPGNRFQTIVIVLIALVTLSFVLVAVLGLWIIQQQQKTFNRITPGLQEAYEKLGDCIQSLEQSLTSIWRIGIDNAEKLNEVDSKQSLVSSEQATLQKAVAENRDLIDNLNLISENLETDQKADNTIEYQQQAEAAVREARAQVDELAQAYRDGEPIAFIDIEMPTPSQKVHLIARYLHQWRSELTQSAQADPNFVRTLMSAEEVVKDQLKVIRGEALLSPNPFDLATDISTDIELNEIRNQCIDYVARFEGMLSGYELRCQTDEAKYEQFISQFIKDQLLNKVTKFISADSLSEKMYLFLQLIDWEIVPIEIGKTKANARVHDIQGSQQTGVETDTIAEIITHGLRRKTDGTIVQRPVVIRGE